MESDKVSQLNAKDTMFDGAVIELLEETRVLRKSRFGACHSIAEEFYLWKSLSNIDVVSLKYLSSFN